MTSEGRRAAALVELVLAREELEAAGLLLAHDKARIALTRAYVAVFHAQRARLYAEGLEPRSHSGVTHLFNLHLVKGGAYPPEVSRLAARLQKYREEADYARAFIVDAPGAQQELDEATALVDRVGAELADG